MIFQKKRCTSVVHSARAGGQCCVTGASYRAVKLSPRTTEKPPVGYSAKSGDSSYEKAAIPSAMCLGHISHKIIIFVQHVSCNIAHVLFMCVSSSL